MQGLSTARHHSGRHCVAAGIGSLDTANAAAGCVKPKQRVHHGAYPTNVLAFLTTMSSPSVRESSMRTNKKKKEEEQQDNEQEQEEEEEERRTNFDLSPEQ